MNRVVITGIGAVSPVGNTAHEMWGAVKNGVNGIDKITKVDTSDLAAKLAGEIKDFDPLNWMDKKDARRMDQFCRYGVSAGAMAMEDSGLKQYDPQRIGTIIGSGVGGLETISTQSVVLENKGPRRVMPLLVPVMICNMISGNLAIKYNIQGHSSCVVTACATGTNAIGDAFRMIKHGYQDIMLAGGSDATLTRVAIAGFLGLQALSLSEDKNRASIPFDKERTGFVMGEGAGVVVLEEYEHARARGAKIYAEVLGYGSTSDAYHMTAPLPDGSGAAQAMKLAMAEGGVTPEMIDYINAHGTSTTLNDATETLAIKKALGKSAYDVSISSTKSMMGHLLGAAGAVEAIIAAKALQEDFVPPTINYKVPDEDCDLDITPNKGKQKTLKYALSNSLGFGGHNATLLLGKMGE